MRRFRVLPSSLSLEAIGLPIRILPDGPSPINMTGSRTAAINKRLGADIKRLHCNQEQRTSQQDEVIPHQSSSRSGDPPPWPIATKKQQGISDHGHSLPTESFKKLPVPNQQFTWLFWAFRTCAGPPTAQLTRFGTLSFWLWHSCRVKKHYRPVFTLVHSRLMIRWVAGSRAVITNSFFCVVSSGYMFLSPRIFGSTSFWLARLPLA